VPISFSGDFFSPASYDIAGEVINNPHSRRSRSGPSTAHMGVQRSVNVNTYANKKQRHSCCLRLSQLDFGVQTMWQKMVTMDSDWRQDAEKL